MPWTPSLVTPPSQPDDTPVEEFIGWHSVLKDDGCPLNPSCLNCPLPECKEDVGYWPALAAAKAAGAPIQSQPERGKRPRSNDPDAHILYYHAKGWTINATARVTGASRDIVRRVFHAAGYSVVQEPVYTPEDKARARELFKEGVSVLNISRQLQMDRNKVYRVVADLRVAA